MGLSTVTMRVTSISTGGIGVKTAVSPSPPQATRKRLSNSKIGGKTRDIFLLFFTKEV